MGTIVELQEKVNLTFNLWGKTRTKNPDGAASQLGPFPHSMAM